MSDIETSPPLDIDNGWATLRRFGSGAMHRAQVLDDWFMLTTWIGCPYWAIHDPIVAACGALLRPDHRGLVAMQAGTKVTCSRCKRLAP